MIKYLLQEAEKVSKPFFSKNELVEHFAIDEFEHLTGLRILSYCKSAKDGHESVRKPRCHCGSPLTVIETDDRLEGFCSEHPEDGPCLLEKDDRIRYEFSIKNLLELIRSANFIDGKLKKISNGCYYLGYKRYPETRVGFALIRKTHNNIFVELSGMKSICEKDKILVVLTLSPDHGDVVLNKNLENQHIIQISLLDVLKTDNFELSINDLISDQFKKLRIAEGIQLTEQQCLDYEQFNYNCYDQIYFLDKHGKGRNYIIRINKDEKSVQYHETLFLIFLAMELKKQKGGWISGKELADNDITRDDISHVQRLRSDLKKKFQPYLRKKNGDDFIENDKKGNYRLSIHPDFVYTPDDNWLSNKFNILKNAAIKERQRREKYVV